MREYTEKIKRREGSAKNWDSQKSAEVGLWRIQSRPKVFLSKKWDSQPLKGVTKMTIRKGFLNWPNPVYFYIFSFFSNTNFTEKTVVELRLLV